MLFTAFVGVVALLVGWNTQQPVVITDTVAKVRAKLGL